MVSEKLKKNLCFSDSRKAFVEEEGRKFTYMLSEESHEHG